MSMTNICCHCRLRFGGSVECAAFEAAVAANCCNNCWNTVAAAESDVADDVALDVDDEDC